MSPALATAIERITCRRCNGVVLARSYSGGWISKHDGRSIKIRGTATIEAECSRGHMTTVRVDEESAFVVM